MDRAARIVAGEEQDMTDRELLELAAKAAGIELKWHHSGECAYARRNGEYWAVWNPRDDDGDALRLAVALNMDIRYALYDSSAAVFVGGRWDGAPEAVHELFEGRKSYTATRRAIVRAAAEIGRNMT